MAHWHDFNPWAHDLVYLASLEEAEALSDRDAEHWLRQSQISGTPGKLDAYLLRDGPLSRGPREFNLGIRWGKEPEEYFSPWIKDTDLAMQLWLKYGGDPR